MNFYKMHGCGNDFCIIDYSENVDYQNLAIKICDRKTGIGADGLILVKKNPLEMIFYNQDGSRASMCGNGIRCFARYVYDKKIVSKLDFDVLTLAGTMKIKITCPEPFKCQVGLGKPLFSNHLIQVNDSVDSFGRIISVQDKYFTIYSFFMGTIHTVIFVSDLNSDMLNYADGICNHNMFKAKTNVNFVQVLDENTIRIKTYERGVGWTLACGTGACASVVCSAKLGLTKKNVSVELELGALYIEIDKKENVFMEGPAVITFTGEYKEV